MPRIQKTLTVRIALLALRIYLVLILVLIVLGFIRNEASLRNLVYPTADTATTAAAMPDTDATQPAPADAAPKP
jgi:hypothetical protein